MYRIEAAAAARDTPPRSLAMPATSASPAIPAVASPLPIATFAWRIAAPIDLVINVVINASIAAWLYRSLPDVPAVTGHSIAGMAVPMTGILATLTTLSGHWNAIRERRAGRVAPAISTETRWLGRGIGDALATGLVAGGTAWLVARWLATPLAAATLPYPLAVAAIGGYAGLLGYVLHGRAVVRGGRTGLTHAPTLGRG